ncbi:MAG: laccase domain-containing protein, partial [Prevotella sp.]|nr:laccase domain-containing protein [Prevotella sp.]
AGVNAANILMSGICTYDHVADYFSARRLGIRSGRIFTGIIINTPLSYAATLIPKC